MDPDETLRLIREQIKYIIDSDRGNYLAELVDDLDAWLSSGAFLPHAWQ